MGGNEILPSTEIKKRKDGNKYIKNFTVNHRLWIKVDKRQRAGFNGLVTLSAAREEVPC